METFKMERYNLIKAMEMLVRHVNNEELMDNWFLYGIADGDIDSSTLNFNLDEYDNMYIYFEEDKEFSDLMCLFLSVMSQAHKDGGLYCDRVVS